MLLNTRADNQAKRQKLLAAVEASGRKDLTGDEHRKIKALRAVEKDLDEQIEDERAEIARSGRHDPETRRIARASSGAEDWADRAFSTIKKLGGSEERAYLASGSVDVPRLIDPTVTEIARPSRLIDLLINRNTLQSNSFEYFR